MATQIITIEVSYSANSWEDGNECASPADVEYESAIDRWLQNQGNDHITRSVKVLNVSPVRYGINEGPDAVPQTNVNQ